MSLLEFYIQTRQGSVDMCQPLKTEDYIPQAAFFASPPKWVLGHTSWFFEEMILKNYKEGYEEFHPQFGFLFNSYYNTLGERVMRHKRGDLSRPTVEGVYQYREWVDKNMKELLQEETGNQELNYLVTLGINHEQQHQELFFTDIKYTFSVNPLFPQYTDKAYCEESENEPVEYINIPEENYEIGFEGGGFCFDNERARHKVYIQPFSIRKKLVTNGEYIEFIEDGGYKKFDYWHDEALFWLAENQMKNPMYWQKQRDDWVQYTLAGLHKINPEHILTHITYYEAFAFSQWKGERLPTEFEWEVASDKFNWGKRWEWTESAYLPYPGYNKATGAVGEYNGKFMVNQKVLRGGSVVTPDGHSRNTYRNFFHPQYGWQFNGIRLVK